MDSADSAALQFNFWKQRLKDNWDTRGDCPTKLMFSKVKQRQRRNDIIVLLQEDGQRVMGQDNLQELITSSLKIIFNSNIKVT